MAIRKYQKTIATKSRISNTNETDYEIMYKYKQLINDEDYFEFVIESDNGGFFYEKSLQLYSYSAIDDFQNINHINSLLTGEYGSIFSKLISFGQDIFGNQFCFSSNSGEIVSFNCQTGIREKIAPNFREYINILQDDLDYLTGKNVLVDWLLYYSLNFDQRLCPKIPFVMGGEFKIANLFAGQFPEYIGANANIARQVYNLPDGTKVRINIDGKPKGG